MAGPPPYRDSGAEADRDSAPGAPAWLKVLGIAVVIVVLLVVAMMLAGGGGGLTPPAGAH